jgi:hypothetical protein
MPGGELRKEYLTRTLREGRFAESRRWGDICYVMAWEYFFIFSPNFVTGLLFLFFFRVWTRVGICPFDEWSSPMISFYRRRGGMSTVTSDMIFVDPLPMQVIEDFG